MRKVMNRLCYGTNEEDYNFDCPEEALDDAWDQGYLNLVDGYYLVYEGQAQPGLGITHDGTYPVKPLRTLKFTCENADPKYYTPKWIPAPS